jgi:cytochrome c-type biogenesis protein
MDTAMEARFNSAVKRLSLALFVVAFLALGVLIALGLSQTQSSGADLDLEPATDFTVPLYSGGTGDFTLSEHLGQPILLNFWGSWCPPCRAEFPAIQAIADAYKDKGLVVIGVGVQDTEDNARAFLIEQGPTFQTGPDLAGSISIDYSVTSMPTTYLITKDGKIFKKWAGLIDEKRLNAFVNELVNM